MISLLINSNLMRLPNVKSQRSSNCISHRIDRRNRADHSARQQQCHSPGDCTAVCTILRDNDRIGRR